MVEKESLVLSDQKIIMPINETLNKILKEMWRLDEKASRGEELNQSEREFFNENLKIISDYYEGNNIYWKNKI